MSELQEDMESTEQKGISSGLMWGLRIGFSLILVFVIWRYLSYVYCPVKGTSPSDLGLPTLFVFAATGLLLVIFPFEKFGLRLKKIGWFEFEQIITTQAEEQTQGLSEIEERLTNLEANLSGVHEGLQLADAYHGPEARKLIMKFLSTYDQTAFSPLRIRQWGAQQPGFEGLKDIDPAVLRSMLRKLLADGTLETKLSKKGNTLYRIAE